MIKVTFTSKQLEEFGVPEEWEQLDEYVDRVEILQNELVNSHKQTTTYEVIFRLDDKYYKCYYYSEYNEGMSWDYWFSGGICDVECLEVEPQTVTIVKYVEKK